MIFKEELYEYSMICSPPVSYTHLDLLAGVEDTDKGFETSVKRDYAYVNLSLIHILPTPMLKVLNMSRSGIPPAWARRLKTGGVLRALR